jgi:peptidoglycan/LPS O-acetylase OafA/YrhL
MIAHTLQEATGQKNKLLGLELIRFASAFAVLVWHYQHFFYVASKPTDFVREQQPFYSLLSLFYDHGFYGVHVFWCISGFIFFWKYRIPIAANNVTCKRFLILRFSRLYPLHFVTLMLVLALQAIYFSRKDFFFVYQSNDLFHFVLQLFMASNWGFENGPSFNGPIWSISVEILIYFCFFITLRKISPSFIVNIGFLLLFLGAKHLGASSPIFECLAFFYVGGLSAIACQSIERTRYLKQAQHLCLLLLIAAPLLVHTTRIGENRDLAIHFLLSYVPVLLFFGARNFNPSPAVRKAIEAAGNMTYSSYLIHFPLQLVIAIYFSGIDQKIPGYSNAFFVGFIAATLLASHYIYKLFELPAQNHLRKRLAW